MLLPSELTWEEARADWHQRENVRKSFLEWVKVAGYTPAAHHRLIIDQLQRLAEGQSDHPNIAFFLPPGSAKSTYASMLFPPWALCSMPGAGFIGASCDMTLAESFGRSCRNYIDLYGNVLGYRLSDDSRAASSWHTSNGGFYIATGVEGRIAGRRCDYLLIDDPIGRMEDAQSGLIRDKQWTWYCADIIPRLKPNARKILIQTRWHEDDLAGRILNAAGDEWTVIRLPMLAEDNDPLGRAVGQRLWPEWFNDKMVKEAMRNPKIWTSLYQQRPTPEEGDVFKASWFNAYSINDLPRDLTIYAAGDFAVGQRKDSNKTCLGCVGVDDHDNIYVLPDIEWGRFTSDVTVEKMLDICRRRSPVFFWAEKGHISKSIGPFLRKRMEEEQVYANIEEVTPVKGKLQRAQSIIGRMAMGKVFFPCFAEWWPNARQEMLSFTGNDDKEDDFVDFLAHIGMGVARMRGAVKHVPEPVQTEPLGSTGISIAWVKREDAERRRADERQKRYATL